MRDTTQRPTPRHSEARPGLPARSRGVIALVEENCTACMLCARECPDWCIYIDSHKETVPAPEGGRPRVRNVLDRFAIDFSLCMYCGICVEVCPFDALFWSPEFEYAGHDIHDLLHEKDRLGEWVATVPNLPPSVRLETPAPATEAASAVPEAAPEQAEAPVRPAAAATATERPTSGGAVPGPGGRPRSGAGSARELLTNVRSIRPPGGLPGGAAAMSEPGGPAAESSAEKPGAVRRPSARDLLANVRSIRPPGGLPGGAAAMSEPGGPAAGSSREKQGEVLRPSARELLANVRSIRPPGGLPADTSAAGAGPDSPAAESPAEKPGGARRPSARELLANVRSIRPPGSLPKDRDDA